jgi:hypothetical protein
MSLASKVAALLAAVTHADVQALAPFERRQLADLCRHVADLCDPPAKVTSPKAGFIAELADGRGRE